MRNGQLRAVTAELKRALARFGMPESVDLRAQDAFVLVGMTATVFSVLPMLQGHRVFGWPPEAGDGARRLVSEAALEAALVAEIAGGLAAEYVARIRRVSAAPIVLVAQPAPSEAAAGAGRAMAVCGGSCGPGRVRRWPPAWRGPMRGSLTGPGCTFWRSRPRRWWAMPLPPRPGCAGPGG
ncbi:hypothetical protein ACFSZS_18840 [Seohaeicola zhoushanensis]